MQLLVATVATDVFNRGLQAAEAGDGIDTAVNRNQDLGYCPQSVHADQRERWGAVDHGALVEFRDVLECDSKAFLSAKG